MPTKLTIPSTLSNPISNNENKFLLLNNEFNNNTILKGFELYGETSGLINIKIVSSNSCGTELNNTDLVIPCSVYFNNYPSDLSLDKIYSFNYTISTGYNKLLLSQPLQIQRGYFILLEQINGKIAIDTSGNATYSDMILSYDESSVSRINTVFNYRFYFNTINPYISYQSNLNLVHSYQNTGSYLITIIFSSSIQIFYKILNISDCKFYLYNSFCFYLKFYTLKFYQ